MQITPKFSRKDSQWMFLTKTRSSWTRHSHLPVPNEWTFYWYFSCTSCNPMLRTEIVGLVSYAPPGSIIRIWGGLTKLLIVNLGQICINHLTPPPTLRINKMRIWGGLTKLLIVDPLLKICFINFRVDHTSTFCLNVMMVFSRASYCRTRHKDIKECHKVSSLT